MLIYFAILSSAVLSALPLFFFLKKSEVRENENFAMAAFGYFALGVVIFCVLGYGWAMFLFNLVCSPAHGGC